MWKEVSYVCPEAMRPKTPNQVAYVKHTAQEPYLHHNQQNRILWLILKFCGHGQTREDLQKGTTAEIAREYTIEPDWFWHKIVISKIEGVTWHAIGWSMGKVDMASIQIQIQ